MKKHYVTEIFYSVQGEGMHVGAPSIFVRLFGCNLRCESFGMPLGEVSKERDLAYELIKTTDITSLEQLPLVKTGCDSYAAWDKRFRHLSEHLTVDEIIERIVELTPNKSLAGIHVVFTGGEPMLKQKLISDISVSGFVNHKLKNITIETNGTKIPDLHLWDNLSQHLNITFSVSQKLLCSGESMDARLNTASLDILFNVLRHKNNINCVYKFVISRESDVDEGLIIVDEVHKMDRFSNYSSIPNVYLMPVGGTKDDYLAMSKTVADLALKYGVYYTPRLHIDIYGNAWAT